MQGMETFSFYLHLKTRSVIITSQMLFPVLGTFLFGKYILCLFSIPEQAPFLLFTAIRCLELQNVRKMSNTMQKKEEKLEKRRSWQQVVLWVTFSEVWQVLVFHH